MRGLATVLAVDPDVITADTTSRDIGAWDSVGTMDVLFWLSTEFEIDLDPGETSMLQSVRGILDLLSAAGKVS